MANIMHNLLAMKEMKIKTSVRWNSAPIISTIFKKLALSDPDVDKDVERVEIPYISDESLNWHNHHLIFNK